MELKEAIYGRRSVRNSFLPFVLGNELPLLQIHTI